MRCPACQHEEDKVLETRAVRDGEAIRRRRFADRPVGAFLDGGAASALVCALARKQTTRRRGGMALMAYIGLLLAIFVAALAIDIGAALADLARAIDIDLHAEAHRAVPRQ